MASGAAAVARARRRVISHFMQNNAVSPDTAILVVPDRPLEERALQRLVGYGVLVETTKHTYYLDVRAYDRWRNERRKRAIIALLIAGLISLLAALLGMFVTGATLALRG